MRLYTFNVNNKDIIEKRHIIYQYRDENRWLSNFWPCQIVLPAELGLPAMTFGSVENAYMAWKTLHLPTREKIQTITPGKAKKLSHGDTELAKSYGLPTFKTRDPYTDDLRIQAMEALVAQKFSKTNPDLLKLLLDTKDALLAEGNLHNDTFFGVDLNKGYGQNHLGRIQMRVRDLRRAQLK